MIHVMHNGIHVATINFGWESAEFYRQWMVGDEDESMPKLHGATIDITSPDKVSPQGILAFFYALLDENWVRIIKSHYDAVKARLAKQAKTRN